MTPRRDVREIRRRASIRLPVAVPLLLLVLAGPAASPVAGAPGDGLLDTGERFRTPVLGAEFRVLRDPATGDKALEGPDGRRFASVEAAVLDEEAAIGSFRTAVDPDLVAAATDPTRAEEPLRVVLLLAEQPLHGASVEVRERTEPAIRARLARMRGILGRIAGARAGDPGFRLQLGDRIEEERRLLTEAERAELKDLQGQVHALKRGMRTEILALARPETRAAQAPILDYLGALQGVRILGTAEVLNAISVELPAGAVAALVRDLPAVVRVLPHRAGQPATDTSVPAIGAASWTGAGYDGSSTTKVAVLDTGIDATHPALASVVSDQGVFLAAGSLDPYFADNATSPDDVFFHGTHVGGIAMSTDATFRGVAPGGKLMNAKCLYKTSYSAAVQTADVMAAGDWAANNGADVLNGSIAFYGITDGSSAVTLFFDAVADGLGISVAAAAGNQGHRGAGTVTNPGDGFNVVTTGAFSEYGTADLEDDYLAEFSSRGPLSDGRRKPDLCAPGWFVSSCNNAWEGAAADFVFMSGTSMAAPHVAGALALLEDYAASWRTETMKSLLLNSTRVSGEVSPSPDDAWGHGALHLATAFARRGSVHEGSFPQAGPSFALLRCGPMSEGARATLCWNRQVVPNGPGAPVTYRPPADLDLTAYEESDGALLGSSASAVDPVEQVALSEAGSSVILKVRRGAIPAGSVSVPWSVAVGSDAAPQPIAAPALACTFGTIPARAEAGDEFLVSVTVANAGGVAVANTSVTLAPPPNYRVVSGPNPATVPTIPAAGSRTVSWTVRAAGRFTGARTLQVTARCTAFGETIQSPAVHAVQSLDSTSPPGGFVVGGGDGYVMPWEAITATAHYQDWAGGPAPEACRFRWDAGTWDPWLSPIGSTVTLPRPEGEGLAAASIQYMLAGGAGSAIFTDGVHLVEAEPPTLARRGSAKGGLGPGGEVVAFRFGALAGDRLDARVRATAADPEAGFRIVTDLYGPDGERTVEGGHPAGRRTPGISGFPVDASGTQWLVLRPEADASAGGTWALRIRVASPRWRTHPRGEAVPAGEPSLAAIEFDAVGGSVLAGAVTGALEGPPYLEAPDGGAVGMEGGPTGRGWKIRPTVLPEGTGTYVLRVPTAAPVRYSLVVRPARD